MRFPRFNFPAYRGQHFRRRFSIHPEADGPATSLAGVTAFMRIRPTTGTIDYPAVIEGDEIVVELTSADTDALPPGVHDYELWVDWAGELEVVLKGRASIHGDPL